MSPAGSILDDPKHWRGRAEEARNVAKQLTDAMAKEMMLRIAEDYDRIAENARNTSRQEGPTVRLRITEIGRTGSNETS
jgi:hypothetical protein